MLQKQFEQTTTPDRGGRAARSLSTCGRQAIRSCSADSATLVSTRQSSKAGSRRLGRSLVGSTSHAAYRRRWRTAGADHPTLVERPQPIGGVRGCGYPAGNGSPASFTSIDPHHRTHSAALRGLGRSAADSSAATATRLVPAVGGGRQSRTGQLRYDRGLGDPRRTAVGRFDGNFAAWRAAGGVGSPSGECQNGGRCLGGALASVRPSRLCPVRQRQPLSWPSPAPGYGRAGNPFVPGLGRHPRLRATQRNRVSGGHREFQWPLAGEGLVALRARFDPHAGHTILQVHYRCPAAQRPAYRSRTTASPLSQTMASEPPATTAWNHRLPATHRRPGPRQPSRPLLPRRCALVAPPRSSRSRSGRQKYPLLRPPTTGTDGSAALGRSDIHSSRSTVQRVTPRY